jgi:hypothetical protein
LFYRTWGFSLTLLAILRNAVSESAQECGAVL